MNATVLSLSFDPRKLSEHEIVIRKCGMDAVSVHSPTEARYEIEMGRCGIFLTTHKVSDLINRDLIELFRRSCPDGWVILITGNQPSRSPYQPMADVFIAESQDPEDIVRALQARQNKALD